jgi:hypothetical protein
MGGVEACQLQVKKEKKEEKRTVHVTSMEALKPASCRLVCICICVCICMYVYVYVCMY